MPTSKHYRDRLWFKPHGWREMVRIMREGGFSDQKREVPLGARVPRHPTPALASANGRPAVTWVGHASFVIQLGGLTLLADPVWSDRLPGAIRRANPPGVAWDALGRVDGVLISHNHYDHLDAPTIDRLPRDTPVFVPANLGAWFTRRGFTRVEELDWWQTTTLRGVELAFVPAKHWSRRGLLDHSVSLWGGWVLTAPNGGRVYFAGDSGYCDAFQEIGSRYPDADVAIVPIGAYEPRWFMEPVHMNPEEAVRAFRDVRARSFVPMHWGTFALTREPLLEPPRRLAAAWAADEMPPDALWDIALGETRAAD